MYILDTDILGIHQRQRGAEYDRVRRRIDANDPADIHVSIITFHEHVIGWSAYLRRAKAVDGVVYGYNMLLKTLIDFGRLNVLRFDESAANIFNQFQRQRLRVGTMDLRIAAIAMASEKTLVTRNTVDFERVPGLRFEDWTLPIK